MFAHFIMCSGSSSGFLPSSIHCCNPSTRSFRKRLLMAPSTAATSPGCGWSRLSSLAVLCHTATPGISSPDGSSTPGPPFGRGRLSLHCPGGGALWLSEHKEQGVMFVFFTGLLKASQLLLEAIRKTFNSVDQQASVHPVLPGKPWASLLGTEHCGLARDGGVPSPGG